MECPYSMMMQSHHNRYPINFNNKEISMNIYVGNLSYEVTEGEKDKSVGVDPVGKFSKAHLPA
jgi:methyl coenzyme M reductase subunit D